MMQYSSTTMSIGSLVLLDDIPIGIRYCITYYPWCHGLIVSQEYKDVLFRWRYLCLLQADIVKESLQTYTSKWVFNIYVRCVAVFSANASSHIIKRRSCVAFEIDNFKNAHKVFESVKGMSRRRCMIRCAGHSLCTGFSYHAHESACALSGKMTCTSITRGLVGWLYAAMSPCLASQTP